MIEAETTCSQLVCHVNIIEYCDKILFGILHRNTFIGNILIVKIAAVMTSLLSFVLYHHYNVVSAHCIHAWLPFCFTHRLKG